MKHLIESIKKRCASSLIKNSDYFLIKKIITEKLTYISKKKMKSILREISRLNESNTPGYFLEMGVALGGSAILIASRCKKDRFCIGYDVFGRIPPPGSSDFEDSHERYKHITSGKSEGISGDIYYGYQENLYESVKNNFKKFGLSVDGVNIKLIKGLFEDSVKFEAGTKIALAHIDCDWHDPVLLCCERIAPFLDNNGVIIIDDYNDYKGCKEAIEKFISRNSDFYIYKTQPHAIIRKRKIINI